VSIEDLGVQKQLLYGKPVATRADVTNVALPLVRSMTADDVVTSRATESSRSNAIALWHTIRQIYGRAVARDVANLVYTNTKLLPATQVGVQTRAYELYELRRRIDGRAEQDWYQAETDLTASSKQSVVDTNVTQEL
jgi:hypothetical protein